ncbi:DUF2971 domain-containing protein [Porphyromonas gulae]|uniref:DUF2971 domain-containing protein n=1 Tax=Porphyromonas gulae TaxID=111105 RepID=UPI0026EEFBDD|nr:DUF2971 domain-containing protein [Porphyromonas gulae]
MLLTELPTYLYGCEELPHKGDGILFHYTKLDSFKKIMEDLTLKPSSFARLNDMNEGNVHNMCLNHNFMVMYNAEEYIKKKCHIISFSQNYDIQGYGVEGTNHPAMWAHYADDSNGVCIVIDKDAFIAKNNHVLSQHFYKFEDVVYSLFNTPEYKDINYEADTPEKFIKNNWKSLFFLKHKDWANEDEHRLFIMDYNGKLNIDGCIKYIVLGRKIFLDNTRIKEILDIVVNPESRCYRKFVPHSFATTCYNTHGYTTFEIAFKIRETVRMNISDPLYADYEKWLIEEQGYG